MALTAVAGCSDDASPIGDATNSGVAEQSPSPVESAKTRPGARGLSLADIEIRLKTVANGLEQPLLVTNAGDGSGRLFVVEQVGRIRILRDGRLSSDPFLDVSEIITAGGEQGLLGLAFHPNYENNGRFYVDYTDANGNDVVAEYSTSSDPDRADPSSGRVLIEIEDPFSNHNGGNLAFGDDGYLYIATGDGGSGGDPLESGQSLDTLLGKILRIDVDSSSTEIPYGIPRDNPFVDRDGARPEIWAYGLRNPWRFSFDSSDIWIGDVGQDSIEEIDRMPADRGGLNYGWNTMEGNSCFDPPSGCDRDGLTLPVATYTHEHGCSVTGGFVYRGESFPSFKGAYFFGDYCSGFIWVLNALKDPPGRPRMVLESNSSISSFGVDEQGELYVTDIASGEVLQVVEAG